MNRPFRASAWPLVVGLVGASLAACGSTSSQKVDTSARAVVASDRTAEQAAFRARVRAIYDFRPRDLDDSAKQSKSRQMDALWKEVKAQPNQYVSWLRAELAGAAQKPFFYFDGTSLLLAISRTPDDFALAARALARVELPDVRPSSYFHLVHRIGSTGVDIVPLVWPMVDDPSFQVSVPEHALVLDQRTAVTYVLLLLDADKIVEPLADRLGRERNPAVARTLMMALAWTITDRARDVLANFASHAALPELADDARTFARFEQQVSLPPIALGLRRDQFDVHLQAFMDREYEKPGLQMERFGREAPYLVIKSDLPRLRALRQERALRVSDEALVEIQFLTQLMQYAATATK